MGSGGSRVKPDKKNFTNKIHTLQHKTKLNLLEFFPSAPMHVRHRALGCGKLPVQRTKLCMEKKKFGRESQFWVKHPKKSNEN